MENFDKKKHWENIYETKTLKEVSWHEPIPKTSIDFITKANLSKDAKIIDVGGGDSFLVDNLLALGYTSVSVLDISEAAIKRAQARLGDKANLVTWIVCDICDFQSDEKYDFWHDRAVFHFLTTDEEIVKYKFVVDAHISDKGTLVVGTFSEQGPLKCSGINIKQYNTDSLSAVFDNNFSMVESFDYLHTTPFDTTQSFLFCTFVR